VLNVFHLFSRLRHLPSLFRLSLALFRDPRVPLSLKAALIGGIALIFSPIDLPAWIPILGEGWDILAIVGILDLFIRNAPHDIVEEHMLRLGIDWRL